MLETMLTPRTHPRHSNEEGPRCGEAINRLMRMLHSRKPVECLVSTDHTGKVLGVTPRTVHRMIKDQQLVAVHLSSKRFGIRSSSIRKFMGLDVDQAA